MTTDRTTRGFTLLEVLVALIIFGIAFGTIAGMFQTSLRHSDTATTLFDAQALAEQQMARFGAEIALAPGEHKGIETIRKRKALAWRGRVSLAEPVVAGDDLALYHIVVDVASEGAAVPLVTLETVRIGTAP
ncbi:MAG: type IV pilus modification PilV family protein [Geminicoccales bacterium]